MKRRTALPHLLTALSLPGLKLVGSTATAMAGLVPAAQAQAPGKSEPGLERIGQAVQWPLVRWLSGEVIPAPWTQGQASLVVFFSTTCPFCARHNEHLRKLAEQVPPVGLKIILAAQEKEAAKVQRYLERYGHALAATLDEKPLHAALSSRKGIPLTCVIDRRGILREVIPGEMFEEDVMELAKWARA